MHEEKSDEVSCIAIQFEEEVLAGGSRVAPAEASTDENAVVFGRHLFQSKKGHRVTCLPASARLLSLRTIKPSRFRTDQHPPLARTLTHHLACAACSLEAGSSNAHGDSALQGLFS
eukprot:1832907-Rhodomonas_salina.1